jgi:predicted benzoate:H+ symporter BenE
MQRKLDDWWVNSKSAKVVGIGIIVGAILVLSGLTFAVLRTLTQLPTWAEVLIALPAGVLFFYWFAKTHETNGFDGPLVPVKREDDRAGLGGGSAAA